MKLFQKIIIPEGSIIPPAWITVGKVTHIRQDLKDATFWRIIFPWWVNMEYCGSGGIKTELCMPSLNMFYLPDHGPERYEWTWIPCKCLEQ